MRYKRRGLLSVVCIVFVCANSCGPRRGDQVLESWETTNGTFKIRIRKFDEKSSVLLPHTYFAFDAAAVGSDEWREVLSWRVDDPIDIPREQVQVVNKQVVCVFANTKYVTTTDAGHTWSVWDARENGPHLPYPLQAWITEAHVSLDGRGRMVLKYRTETEFTLGELNTTDYGVHWR